MNKKNYYSAIEEYNQLLYEKSFNLDFFPKEKQERFENLRKSLLDQVKKQDLTVASFIQKGVPLLRGCKDLDKLRMLKKQLEESTELEKVYYEESWVEELWFGFFTREQAILITLVMSFVIFILQKLGIF